MKLEMYQNVKTWKDLCETNVKFLQGEYKQTFYHWGPIDRETNELVEDLIELNKLGIYTTNSQPYLDTINEPNGSRQISYVEFNCEISIGLRLFPVLLQNPDIYFNILSVGKTNPIYFNTFPTKRFNLTCWYEQEKNLDGTPKLVEYSNFHTNNFITEDNKILGSEIYFNSLDSFNPNHQITQLLKESIGIFISGREHGKPFNVISELVKMVKQIK